MRLVTYRGKHEARRAARAGVLVEDGVIDVSRLVGPLPTDVLGLIQGGQDVLNRVREGAARASATPLADVTLLAPIQRPPKIVCIGVNYADHAAEAGRAVPPLPSVAFMKAPSCIIGPGDPIVRPPTTQQLDYEVELAVVIGRTTKAVSKEEALSHVAGYTIMNDASARDLQRSRDVGIILGKNFDTSAPLGPAITLTDEIPDPSNLGIRTWINGELRQDGNTRNLIFDVPAIVAYVSQQLTLEPGDLIATGTPAGVGLGMSPQVWLQPGDTVRMEIDGIGILENPVT